jgi:hypothetical protein
MTTPREQFQSAYRIARLCKHKYACLAAMRRDPGNPYLVIAVRLWCTSRWLFGVEASRNAQRLGRSFKTAIRGNLKAARYRALQAEARP